MLAVQQAPRMGSSQPPSDPFLPFGYSIDPNQEPLPEPPEPAPGNPLLSDNDNNLLSNFFEDIASNHYSMPSFGEGLNFSESWLDLPPQFMGTATSFGQEPGLPLESPNAMHGFHGTAHGYQGMLPMAPNSMPPPPPPPHPSLQPQSHLEHRHTSHEVLNAAATLLKNGPAQRQNSLPGDNTFMRRPIGPPVGHLRHQPMEEFKEEGRRSASMNAHDNTFTEWMFGPQGRQNPRNAPPTDVQWGSDASFNHMQFFTPNSDRETAESLSNEQMKYLECLEPSQSAENTRPSSPNPAQTGLPTNPRLPELVTRQREADAPPRKRRKSRNNKDAPENDAEAAEAGPSKPVRRKKSKAERSSGSSPPNTEGAIGKRRKSSANGTKPPRENLSEEQKRENHIKSEQKRRTLIKEGFDGLCNLVPGLRGGGFSKSTMLAMTAEWLDDLLKGNEVLESQLAALERRNC